MNSMQIVQTVVPFLVLAGCGLGSIVESLCEVCIQIIQSCTAGMSLLGGIGIAAIIMLFLKYEFDEAGGFCSSVFSFFKNIFG